MKRIIFSLMIGLFAFSAWAVDIEEQELEKISDEVVEFFNYVGPHDKIETDEQIRSIGAGLSRLLENGVQGAKIRRAAYSDKYRIIHIVAPAGQQGLNADILMILEKARVDHVDNIRRILSGYIGDVYGVETERADALATFITIYNAIYRQDMEYISTVYSDDVLNELVPDKAGMSRRYDEWPGRTQILIPLTQLKGETVPAAEVLGGDEKIVDELRAQEDRGIEERKEVVEMREEELEEDLEKLEEEKAELAGEEQKLEEMKEEPLTQPQEIEEQEKVVEEKREEIEQTEEELEDRKDKIAAERELVAEDQKEIIAREKEEREPGEEREAEQAAPAATTQRTIRLVPFIYVEERQNNPFGRLVLIDNKGTIEKRSRLNTIRTRDIIQSRDLLYAAAGEDSPPRAVRLVALDVETLEVTAESEVDVFSGTTLRMADDHLYCVVKEGSNYFLGRFDLALELVGKSALQVARYTSIYPNGDRLLIQGRDGKILQIDPESLEEM